MRRTRFFNTILTINAAALCTIAVIFATERGAFTPSAQAAEEFALPDAGAQRFEMIRELRRISASLEELRKDLDKREFNVRVISMPPSEQKPAGE